MHQMAVLADHTGYWVSGILTVVAAVTVTLVILISSRSRKGRP